MAGLGGAGGAVAAPGWRRRCGRGAAGPHPGGLGGLAPGRVVATVPGGIGGLPRGRPPSGVRGVRPGRWPWARSTAWAVSRGFVAPETAGLSYAYMARCCWRRPRRPPATAPSSSGGGGFGGGGFGGGSVGGAPAGGAAAAAVRPTGARTAFQSYGYGHFRAPGTVPTVAHPRRAGAPGGRGLRGPVAGWETTGRSGDRSLVRCDRLEDVEPAGPACGADRRDHPDDGAERHHTAELPGRDRECPSPSAASIVFTIAQPRKVPRPSPPTVPNRATTSASPRTIGAAAAGSVPRPGADPARGSARGSTATACWRCP